MFLRLLRPSEQWYPSLLDATGGSAPLPELHPSIRGCIEIHVPTECAANGEHLADSHKGA